MTYRVWSKISSGNAFSELGSIGTPLNTNGTAQCFDHLSVNVIRKHILSILSSIANKFARYH